MKEGSMDRRKERMKEGLKADILSISFGNKQAAIFYNKDQKIIRQLPLSEI